MPKLELTGKRLSRLSIIFRRHSLEPEKGGTGRLLNWTRHVDCDWRFYCPHCGAIVVLIEEKSPDAAAHAWNVTRRAATRHQDHPWAWKVVYHDDETFTLWTARAADTEHISEGPQQITEDALIARVEAAFLQHYIQAGHPANLLPARYQEAAA